jgi:hypothetical protein
MLHVCRRQGNSLPPTPSISFDLGRWFTIVEGSFHASMPVTSDIPSVRPVSYRKLHHRCPSLRPFATRVKPRRGPSIPGLPAEIDEG